MLSFVCNLFFCSFRPNSPSPASPEVSGVRGAPNVTGLVNVVEHCTPWLRVVEPHKELLLRHLRFFLSSAINGKYRRYMPSKELDKFIR